MADVFPIRVRKDDPARAPADLAPALARREDFNLGAILVRPSQLALEGPSGRMLLERRMMEVLLAFVDADGAVLTREDLMSRCWRGVIVGDDAVHRVISGLRKAAAGAGGGFTIETVPRIGYRLQRQSVAEVTLLNGRAATMPDDAPDIVPAPSTPANSVSRRWLLAGGAAIVSAGGLAVWMNRSPPPDPQFTRMMTEAQAALRLGYPDTDRRAIAMFERAVARSPGNAEAWGMLALARARTRTDEHAGPDSPVSPAAQVEKEAGRALALDQRNADAKAALAIAIPYYGDWLAAERRFDAVLAQHPGHLITRDSRAFLLSAVGRVREGAEARLAFSTDAPFDANLQFRQIYALWFLNRIDEADRVASRGMEMWPRHYGIWFGRLWLLAGTGRFDRALVQIDDEPARPPLPPPMVGTLRMAMGAILSGREAEKDQAVARVMAAVGQSVAAVVNAMMLLNLLGATDKAFDLAQAYYLEQGPIIASMQWRPGQPVIPDQRRRKTNMLFTPVAEAMRRDPRFAPLMQQMGLARYWDQRGIGPDFLI